MTIRTKFASLSSSIIQPLSLFDQQFADVAGWALLPCTASGSNSITLQPMNFVPDTSTIPAYTNLITFSFIAAANSTAAVVAQFQSLAQIPVFLSDGVTQAGSGSILAGQPYQLQFSANLGGASGGFYLLQPAKGTAAGVTPQYGVGFASGLTIANGGTPNTQMSVTATAIWMSTLAQTQNIFRSNFSQVLSTSVSGAGGLDTGSLGTNKWYNVFAIDNGSFSNTLMSLSPTAPLLPSGYIYALRVGAVFVDGSGNLLRTRQAGVRGAYVVTPSTNTPNLPIIATGNTGNPATPTYTSFQVQGGATPTTQYVPPSAQIITARLSGGGASAVILLAPNNNYGVQGSLTNAPLNLSGNQAFQADLVLESPNIFIAMSSTSTTVTQIYAAGWVDSVSAC